MHPTDGWSYRGPKISEVPDGRLVMNATRFENEGDTLFDTESEALQRPEMLLFWSEDQGKTWSEPQVGAGRPAARKVHMEWGWTSPTTGGRIGGCTPSKRGNQKAMKVPRSESSGSILRGSGTNVGRVHRRRR